jgi:decaprenylphospho-beta-D-ribofuranose 2-oxidase
MNSSWIQKKVWGWGQYPRLLTYNAYPQTQDELKDCFNHYPQKPTLAYGLGRSYGDTGLLAEGHMLHTRGLNRILHFDPESGWVRCEAGVSLYDLIQTFVPQGFFPPVVPGTQYVTVGGAVANDIHGKNHHVDGTFCDHIRSVEMLLASGEVVVCDQDQNSELFWATVGGIGLTGILLSLELKLVKIEGPGIDMESIRIRDLDHFFEISAESKQFTHTVSWVDCIAKGKQMGRGIFMRGRHSTDIPKPRLLGRIANAISPLLNVPFNAPSFLLNPWSMKAFNTVYFHKHPNRLLKQTVAYDPFFFPLDFVRNWNRIYGKRGFLQYQFVVPHEANHKTIRQILSKITSSGMGSFLAVIKEFGNQTHSGLSFPQPGVTLALDFPNYGQPLLDLLFQLDRLVMQAGGRVYLGKDARLPQDHFQEMYPQWQEWKALRDQWDPQNRFQSTLGLRLGLVSP